MSAKIPPKPGKDVIYIDVDDEITSIIDKVENSKEKVAALVLPKRAASLQSIVNMKLLKRSADEADKNVVLITSEAALLPLAGAAGLHVAKNLQSAPEIPSAPAGALAAGAAAAKAKDEPAEEVPEEVNEEDMPKKIDYAAGTVGALALAHDTDSAEAIDLDDEDAADTPKPKAAKAPKDKKNKVPNFDRFRSMLGLGIGGFIALIVFIFLAIFVLPKATITITTSSEPVSANFNITASTNIKTLDAQKGQIPATQQTTDQTGSQSVTATGQQNNGQTATGSVSMTATKCSGNPFVNPDPVPSGTGISSGGQNYLTQESTSFHGTGTNGSGCYVYSSNSNTDITAQAAGSKYNVSSGTFSVAGRSDVSASGSASGGTDSIQTVVSQSDVDGAKQKIASGNSSDDFVKSWKQKLQSQGQYVIDATLKTSDPSVTSSPAVGQPASNATVTVKTTYTVLTVAKTDLDATIQAQMAGQYDKSKQKLSDNYLNDTTFTLQGQSSATSATLAVNVNTTAVPIINPANVKKVAAGKKTGDVTAVINGWGGVKTVKVDLSPFWVSRVPNKEKKITVVIKEVRTSSNNSSEP